MDNLLATKATVDQVEYNVVGGAVEGGRSGVAIDREQEGRQVCIVAQFLGAVGTGETGEYEALLAGTEEGEVDRPHWALAGALCEEGEVLGGVV